MNRFIATRSRSTRVLVSAVLLAAFATATSFSQIPIGIPIGPPGGMNKAPVVTNMFAYQLPNKRFNVSGTVSDETPATNTVAFSGAGIGNVGVNGGGGFNTILAVNALGQLTATPNDGALAGQPYTITLQNAAPTIGNFTAIAGNNGQWTFSGTVTDEAPAGLTLKLSGFQAGFGPYTTQVSGNGSFSFTIQLPSNASGTITANVTDWYGASGSATTIFGS